MLGDAGYCPSLLTGQGTSLAMIGAYILAGELKAAGGDHEVAFKKYESETRRFVDKEKKTGLNTKFLVPATNFGIRWRNRLTFLLNMLLMIPKSVWKWIATSK